MLATGTSAAGYGAQVDTFLRQQLEIMKERPSRAKILMAGDEASTPSAGLDERLKAISAVLDVALAEFSMHLSASVRGQMRNELRRLLAPDVWEEDEALPSVDSFVGLLQFLSNRLDMAAPSVGVAPSGNFLAAWRPGTGARLTLEFLSANSVRWILMDARNKQTDRPITGAGVVPISALAAVIEPYGASEWVIA